MDRTKIVACTESQLKIRAICAAIAPHNLLVGVVPCKVSSGISEQLIGPLAIEQGARNRVSSAESLCPDGDLYISMESGFVQLLGGADWFDQTYVLIRTRSGRESLLPSAPFPIPQWMYRRTIAHYRDLGALIQDLNDGGEKDVQAHLSRGAAQREQIIAQTVQCALVPLLYPERYEEPF